MYILVLYKSITITRLVRYIEPHNVTCGIFFFKINMIHYYLLQEAIKPDASVISLEHKFVLHQLSVSMVMAYPLLQKAIKPDVCVIPLEHNKFVLHQLSVSMVMAYPLLQEAIQIDAFINPLEHNKFVLH